MESRSKIFEELEDADEGLKTFADDEARELGYEDRLQALNESWDDYLKSYSLALKHK